MAEIIGFLSNTFVSIVLLGYVVIVWIALVVWTSIDVFNRTNSWWYRILAILLVGIGTLFGFILYLLVRPPTTKEDRHLHELEEKLLETQARSFLCPSCRDLVREDFLFCPTCGLALKRECSSCQKALDIVWTQCPYCGFKVGPAILPEVAVSAQDTNGSLLHRFTKLFLRAAQPSELKRGRGRPRKNPVPELPVVKRPRGRPKKDAVS